MSAYAHAEKTFLRYIEKERMAAHLSHGALLGLSGGKDSVLLLSLFHTYANERGIPFAALHLHHGIRGAEADADAAFCRALCEERGIPFILRYADIPMLADLRGEGIEETARHERYAALCEECRARGFSAILTAHTASDLAETVVLSLLRGGGTKALGGIPPVRREGELAVLRPLLSLTSDEVLAACASRTLSFACDETNADTKYRRNFVRHEILPKLANLTPSPERAISRFAENARCDEDYLQAVARDAYASLCDEEGCLDGEKLSALHPAIAFRVLRCYYGERLSCAPLPERVHTDALLSRIEVGGDFSLSLPGGVCACYERGCLSLSEGEIAPLARRTVHLGVNRLSDGSLLLLLEKTTPALPQNIYSLSTQRPLTSATIEGELYVRAKEAGDAYHYGGMTHKLKKLFSDRKLSHKERRTIPVLCDGRGILWVPSFGVRDDGVKNGNAPIALYIPHAHLTDEVLAQIAALGYSLDKA